MAYPDKAELCILNTRSALRVVVGQACDVATHGEIGFRSGTVSHASDARKQDVRRVTNSLLFLSTKALLLLHDNWHVPLSMHGWEINMAPSSSAAPGRPGGAGSDGPAHRADDDAVCRWGLMDGSQGSIVPCTVPVPVPVLYVNPVRILQVSLDTKKGLKACIRFLPRSSIYSTAPYSTVRTVIRQMHAHITEVIPLLRPEDVQQRTHFRARTVRYYFTRAAARMLYSYLYEYEHLECV